MQAEAKSIVFIGMTRGGSSIISEIISVMAQSQGYEAVDIEGGHYDRGVPPEHISPQVFENIALNGYYYGPFRGASSPLRKADLRGLQKIVVVRDPRDCLVSHYYAMKNIHTSFSIGKNIDEMQKGREISLGIDDHCLDVVDDYREILRGLMSFLYRNSDAIVYRYEDIFSNPMEWIMAMSARLGFVLSDEALAKAVVMADFVSASENEFAHKRQGRPGDHIQKLRGATIESISRSLEPELSLLGYGVTPARFAVRSESRSNDLLDQQLAALKCAIMELATENGYRIEEGALNRECLAKISERLENMEGKNYN